LPRFGLMRPNAMQMASATALLPEPFWPVVKLTLGSNSISKFGWHVKSRSMSLLRERGHEGQALKHEADDRRRQ